MSEVEIWKFIPGYENYMISNMGRIKHFRTGKFRSFRLHSNGKNSYKRLRVALSIPENKKRHFCVHLLVAENFLENPNGYNKLLFLDGNYKNCKSKNLKYVSDNEHKIFWKDKEDIDYQYYGNTPKPVKAIHSVTGNEIVFESLKAAARFLKTKPDYINKVLRGIQKTHRQYQFQLITN